MRRSISNLQKCASESLQAYNIGFREMGTCSKLTTIVAVIVKLAGIPF
jgi:hypothetical protein